MGISVIGGSAASNASNVFYVDISANDFSYSQLASVQSAGQYRIASQEDDQTLDIYAITPSGGFAGYTNNSSLTVTDNFDSLFIFGANVGDLITFEQTTIGEATAAETTIGASPYITNISNLILRTETDEALVTGGNFSATTQAVFVKESDGSEVTPGLITFVDATSISVRRPSVFNAGNYAVKVFQPGVPSPSATNAHITAYVITNGQNPVWDTAPLLPTFSNDVAYSTTISVTDPDNQLPITYELTAGSSLATGLSLNSATGVISGTPTGQNSANIFTINAIDSAGNTASRTFTIPLLFLNTYTASGSFTVPAGVNELEIEVVSGGGGTSPHTTNNYQIGCGGGGAGGYIVQTHPAESGDSITFTVGAGGAGKSGDSNGNGNTGSASTVLKNGNTLFSVAGGGYGSCFSDGGNGACGGGCRNSNRGTGYIGGNGGNSDSQYGGGGGGGMNGNGQSVGSYQGGNGGTGVYMISGLAVCGGGGGNSPFGSSGGASFGGGNGSQSAPANRGGGAGGIAINTNRPMGTSGGSGLVVISYLLTS